MKSASEEVGRMQNGWKGRDLDVITGWEFYGVEIPWKMNPNIFSMALCSLPSSATTLSPTDQSSESGLQVIQAPWTLTLPDDVSQVKVTAYQDQQCRQLSAQSIYNDRWKNLWVLVSKVMFGRRRVTSTFCWSMTWATQSPPSHNKQKLEVQVKPGIFEQCVATCR